MNAGIMLFGVAALCALVFLVRGIEGDPRAGAGAMGGNADPGGRGLTSARATSQSRNPTRDKLSLAMAVLGTAAAVAGAYFRYLAGGI